MILENGKPNNFSYKESDEYSLKIWIPLFLCWIVCVTNLAWISIELVYILGCMLILLFLPLEYGLSVILVNTVYLGFSFITFSNPFMSTTDFCNVCILLLCVKIVIMELLSSDFKLIYTFNTFFCMVIFIYIIYRSYCRYLITAIFNGAMLICVYFYAEKLKNDEEFRKLIAIHFSLTVLTVFCYYFLQMGQYDTTHASWVGKRFTGVRDPNNFALWSNISIIFLAYFLKDAKAKFEKYRRFALIALSIGTIITLSVSGIGTLIFIWLSIWSIEKGNRKVYAVSIVTIAVLFLLPLIILVGGESDSLLGAISQRLNIIVTALESRDYQTITTGRYWLWNYYLGQFNNLSFGNRIWGSPNLLTTIMGSGILASHNEFIDILLSYGYLGFTMIVMQIAKSLIGNYKEKNNGLFVLNLIIVVNLLFRSSTGVLTWLCAIV